MRILGLGFMESNSGGIELKISYDTDINALYVLVNEGKLKKVSKTFEVESAKGVLVDLDDEGNLVGIEILGVQKGTKA